LNLTLTEKKAMVKDWFHYLSFDEFKELRDDKAFMEEIMQEVPQAIMRASEELQNDDDLLKTAYESKVSWVLEFIDNEKALDLLLVKKMENM